MNCCNRHVRSALVLSALVAMLASSSRSDTHYVWQGSPNPSFPFTNWDTAAHAMQPAADEARNVTEVACWAHARRKFFEAQSSDLIATPLLSCSTHRKV